MLIQVLILLILDVTTMILIKFLYWNRLWNHYIRTVNTMINPFLSALLLEKYLIPLLSGQLASAKSSVLQYKTPHRTSS